jgi:hypothetical protein
MCGETVSPLLTAYLARRPAVISALGLEVLVQEVMAASTTEPCRRLIFLLLMVKFLLALIFYVGIPKPLKPCGLVIHFLKSVGTLRKRMLSWGRLGPAILGYTEERLRLRVLVYRRGVYLE